ncbi:MAG: DNA-deoxyinosine glycosylase [Methylicorpusculum sp.]|uniref:DNA-deoxyinosine glycosylase n=1 Tax=Methylicorpusculum sp. TaxID=2713644 RepID=UPI00271BF504|nr:DNA-deoxyinosine glycosylase [Methylicorpusculum sp.]MDO8938904.1 DNA-deoxyinosine glycosylase [Methylicorpusculum sp.]MDP2204661.1 DNA-deoxyinosine glycosylase [Methylicorpusculum sp.]
MNSLTGFGPIATADSKILILGSMPGVQSLQKTQYYGHPRNAFWPIMAALFNDFDSIDYEAKKRMLERGGIAVWDVIQNCNRRGSLDAHIEKTSIQPNNFRCFFNEHPNITTVFFNGATAEKLFKSFVLSTLDPSINTRVYHRLPSTSPANAGLSLHEKTRIWKSALAAVL